MTGMPQSWREMADRARDRACRSIYVVGDTDSGKTTLARWLLEQAADRRGWYLDCDPGQSELGPPGTVGLFQWRAAPEPRRAFIGSTSPARHLLQTLSGIGRLSDMVPAGELVVFDSSGFVSGQLGGEFQYNLISLLRPDLVVAIEADEALRTTLAPFEAAGDIDLRHLDRHPDCGRKSRASRNERRSEHFRRYFDGAEEQRLEVGAYAMHGMLPETPARPSLRHRLCALLDERQLVTSVAVCLDAEVDGRHVHALELLAPPFDPDHVVSVQLGSIRLAPEDLTYRARSTQPSPTATAVR
jgi:polynucleotide 5'-kinase involved in rRNA processing